AAIELQGGVTISEPLGLTGNGLGIDFSTIGALKSVGGANTWTGDIALTGTSIIGVDAGSSLNLNAAVRALPGAINSGLTKVGGGQLELSGTGENQISGPVLVLQGTLLLNKSGPGNAIDGTLTIGDNIQGDNASVVRLARSNQIVAADFFNTTLN